MCHFYSCWSVVSLLHTELELRRMWIFFVWRVCCEPSFQFQKRWPAWENDECTHVPATSWQCCGHQCDCSSLTGLRLVLGRLVLVAGWKSPCKEPCLIWKSRVKVLMRWSFHPSQGSFTEYVWSFSANTAPESNHADLPQTSHWLP